MLKLLILLLFSSNVHAGGTKIIVDVWGYLAEYGSLDNPPKINQLDRAELALGSELLKAINCNECQIIYNSNITKAYGDITDFVKRNSLPSGLMVQHSNFGIDYFSATIDYFFYYNNNILSLDFDSTFYNFFSNSPWRNYWKLFNLINEEDTVIVMTTNHNLGSKFYEKILKDKKIYNLIILVKDIKGDFLYQTPQVRDQFIYYVHEIELKDKLNQLRINNKVWDFIGNELKSDRGLSESLYHSLLKKQDDKAVQQSLSPKSRKKQSDLKIQELYKSLQKKYN